METHLTTFVQAYQKLERFLVIKLDSVPVHFKKRRHNGYGESLVPVNERMILRKALPQGRYFLDQSMIVTGLWTRHRRLDAASITDTIGASEFPQ